MNTTELAAVKQAVFDSIGVQVDGRVDSSGPRQGLRMWFLSYTSQDGPLFRIRPNGLNRHLVSMEFGKYSKYCIQHIRERITAEDLNTAQAHLNSIKDSGKVELKHELLSNREVISANFSIEATLRGVSNQHGSDEIVTSIQTAMVPMMAAMAELIGYEEEEPAEVQGEVDGEITEVTTKRRERNPRNRLLCLKIHGHHCGVCGFEPSEKYQGALAEILEVHHIEPLSEVDEARIYDPATDLIPLCPNCHRAIHTRKPAYSLEELKTLMKI